MAQLLIRAKDQPLPEGVTFTDKLFWKAGDLVGAFPDDHVISKNEDKRRWIAEGKPESEWPGDYVIVHVTDLPLDKARRALRKKYRAAVGGEDEEAEAPDPGDQKVLVARQAWRAVISEIQDDHPVWFNTLVTDGYNEITVDQVRGYIREKLSEKTLVDL